jgi:hypothetical protein
MTATAFPQDPRQDAINTVARLLIQLFGASPQQFVMTNDSVARLIDGLLDRINVSFQNQESDILLRAWAQRVPEFQRQLLGLATQRTSEDVAVLQRPVVTQIKANQLLELCPYSPKF